MKVAFYKAEGQFYNKAIRKWEKGIYSHVELVFSDGRCASSSFRDKGVRFKYIDLDTAKWDFLELPDALEAAALDWFNKHEKCSYDLAGQLRFVISPVSIGNDDDDWWCSEAVAAALGMPEPWRYGPNSLYSALAWVSKIVNTG